MVDKKDNIGVNVRVAGADAPGDEDSRKRGTPKEAIKVDNGKDVVSDKNVSSENQEDTSSEENKESKKGENVKGKKAKTKEKKSKRSKKKEHQKIPIKDIPALLFPEHVGDIFMILVVLALALGAGAFWLLAWLPTNEPAATAPQESIRRFSEDELQEIIEILDAREEASRAPVNPPTRDPFGD